MNVNTMLRLPWEASLSVTSALLAGAAARPTFDQKCGSPSSKLLLWTRLAGSEAARTWHGDAAAMFNTSIGTAGQVNNACDIRCSATCLTSTPPNRQLRPNSRRRDQLVNETLDGGMPKPMSSVPSTIRGGAFACLLQFASPVTFPSANPF